MTHARGDIGGILNRIMGGGSPGMVAFVQVAEDRAVFRDRELRDPTANFLVADNHGLWDSAWTNADRCVVQVTTARGQFVTEFPLAW